MLKSFSDLTDQSLHTTGRNRYGHPGTHLGARQRVDELLPGARRYQTDKHQVVYGLLAGMVIVALSLLLI